MIIEGLKNGHARVGFWGGEREIGLHPGREKGNAVTSGEGMGKCGYIRGGNRKIWLHLGESLQLRNKADDASS